MQLLLFGGINSPKITITICYSSRVKSLTISKSHLGIPRVVNFATLSVSQELKLIHFGANKIRSFVINTHIKRVKGNKDRAKTSKSSLSERMLRKDNSEDGPEELETIAYGSYSISGYPRIIKDDSFVLRA